MDFKKLEELTYEASVARNQNLRSKATKIEEENLEKHHGRSIIISCGR